MVFVAHMFHRVDSDAVYIDLPAVRFTDADAVMTEGVSCVPQCCFSVTGALGHWCCGREMATANVGFRGAVGVVLNWF